MTERNYVNNAPVATLTPSGISASTAVFNLSTTTGFPTVPFTATLDPDTASAEVVLVNNVSTLQVSVTRGYNGTTAVSHSLGAQFRHDVVALDFTEANTHINATTDVHGFTGTIVGTTGSQSVSSKTFNSSGGVATATAPAFTLDTTASDANLLTGRRSGTTVASIDRDGNGVLAAKLAVGSTTLPTTAIVEATSGDTKVPVRGKSAPTTIGLQAAATSGTARTDVYPGRLVVATDQTVTPLDVQAAAASPLIATLKNSGGTPQFTVSPIGAVTATTATFTDSVTSAALLITRYGSTAARDSALGSVGDGAYCFVTGLGAQFRHAASWVNMPLGMVMYSFLAEGFTSDRSTGAEVRQTGFTNTTSIALLASRAYRIVSEGRVYTDTAGTYGDVVLRGISGASVPAASAGTVLRKHSMFLPTGGGGAPMGYHVEGLFKVTTSGSFSFGVYVDHRGGGGDFGLSAPADDGVSFWIEDIGPVISGITSL